MIYNLFGCFNGSNLKRTNLLFKSRLLSNSKEPLRGISSFISSISVYCRIFIRYIFHYSTCNKRFLYNRIFSSMRSSVNRSSSGIFHWEAVVYHNVPTIGSYDYSLLIFFFYFFEMWLPSSDLCNRVPESRKTRKPQNRFLTHSSLNFFF